MITIKGNKLYSPREALLKINLIQSAFKQLVYIIRDDYSQIIAFLSFILNVVFMSVCLRN